MYFYQKSFPNIPTIEIFRKNSNKIRILLLLFFQTTAYNTILANFLIKRSRQKLSSLLAYEFEKKLRLCILVLQKIENDRYPSFKDFQ